MGSSPSILTRYDDARFFTWPGVGPADPALAASGLGGLYLPEFPGTGVAKSIFGRVQMPHSYREGTDVQVHVHWMHQNLGADANVRWILEYAWANRNGTFTPTTTGATVAATSSAQSTHVITDIVTPSGTGKTISSIMLIRLTRDPGDVLDTYTGSVFFVDMDCHVVYDSIGSDAIFTKA